MGEDVATAASGRTIPSWFLDRVAESASADVLRWASGDGWASWTFAEYAALVSRCAEGLRALGVGPGDRLLLLMRNRPEFHVVDLATLFLGATPISVYNSSSREQIAHVVAHSGAHIAVVEGCFVDRVGTAPGGLREVVVIGGTSADLGTHGYDEVLQNAGADLHDLGGQVAPHDLATVIYTSGTTGAPKGVVIDHGNVCWAVESFRRTLGRPLSGLRTISYLPMAHIAERLATHYLGSLEGLVVTTCANPAELPAHMRAVRPEILFGVPRVWEKIQAGILASIGTETEHGRALAAALARARPLVLARALQPLADADEKELLELDRELLAPVRAAAGLERLVVAATGAAPLPVAVFEWFLALGVPLSEVYGLSETTGPLTWTPFAVKPGTTGPAVAGCEVRLAADGEVLARGGNVFRGYLGDDSATAAVMDADGWLYTGDVGTIDADGYLSIIDRKKELIITSGGKNISPANLESQLKSIPLVGQAFVVGDGRPYVAALLVLDLDRALPWAAARGYDVSAAAALAELPELLAEIDVGVEGVNSRVSRVERIRRWEVLAMEWLPDSEELTPTAKLKRRSIAAKYAATIDDLYSGADPPVR